MARRRAAAPPRQRPRRPARRPPAVVTPTVAGSIPEPAPVTGVLHEDPHAHIVCRQCGRISGVALTQLELYELELLAQRQPSGWVVDAVAFSLNGRCPKCRA